MLFVGEKDRSYDIVLYFLICDFYIELLFDFELYKLGEENKAPKGTLFFQCCLSIKAEVFNDL